MKVSTRCATSPRALLNPKTSRWLNNLYIKDFLKKILYKFYIYHLYKTWL